MTNCQEVNIDLAQQHYDYWLARVAIQMPHPNHRVLQELGKAAYCLSTIEAQDD